MNRALQGRRYRSHVLSLAMIGFSLMSIFGLGGCRVVEGIFKVGAWFGALIVLGIVALIGGIGFFATKRS